MRTYRLIVSCLAVGPVLFLPAAAQEAAETAPETSAIEAPPAPETPGAEPTADGGAQAAGPAAPAAEAEPAGEAAKPRHKSDMAELAARFGVDDGDAKDTGTHVFPKASWRDEPDPIASPDAIPGGEIRYAAAQPPKSLNAYLDNNTFSAMVFGSLYETLLWSNPLTGDYEPGLAKSWTISENKRVFTFTLDEMARWSDGKPVTAEDVRWTFDRLMDPASQTGPVKVTLQTFAKTPPEILDERTIRFTASETHWRNLGAAGGFEIMPKHAFEGGDFNKVNFFFPVVSGPYALGAMREGVELRLERRDDWWARARTATRGTMNFQTVVFRFFAEQENAFEAFKKGEIDVYPVYTARIWATETSGPKFDSNWIVRRRVRNHHPTGFQGFAMNLRRPPFDDVRVRRAMAYALNREKMNATLMYGEYFLHKSYFEDLYDRFHPCDNTEYGFDKDKARELLAEAGYEPDPETGLLRKNGAPLSFTFLTRDGSSDKFLAPYAEDLRDIGVEMKIERKDWAAWSRDMDDYNFDMTWAAWSSGLFKDPEGMWSSAEADRPGGNNITGFRSADVDRLIERQKSVFDLRERNDICRLIDALVTDQVPYVLLWNTDSIRLLYWDKFGTPPTVLSKFGDERSLLTYWWADEDSRADLEAAMADGEALPPRPDVVDFDAAFANP